MLSYLHIRHARELYILTNSFSKPWSQHDIGCSFIFHSLSLWAVYVLLLLVALWAVYNYILLHLVSCWYIATPCLCERRLFLETNCNCVDFFATKRPRTLLWTHYEKIFKSLILTFADACFFKYSNWKTTSWVREVLEKFGFWTKILGVPENFDFWFCFWKKIVKREIY